jgi:K+-transporting ATPase ATPase C chain
MLAELRPALVLLLLLTVLTGGVYPLLVTGAAQAVPGPAGGSLLTTNGRVVGSTLIGQAFDDPRYLWGRPSAIGYDAMTSSGTNQGPSSPALRDAVSARIAALRAAGPVPPGPVPVDLVTASGSGLDPHVTPAAARYQAPRIAAARGRTVDDVLAVLARVTERPGWGFFGEARVNVLAANLALDTEFAGDTARPAAGP